MVKPGTTNGAEAADKATGGRITWLRTECRDGESSGPERPRVWREDARSQSLHSTAAATSGERAGQQNRPREGRQEAGNGTYGTRQWEFRECRQGYTRTRLHKEQTPLAASAAGCGGRKPRSGRTGWCRRWATASEEANGSV